MTNETGILVTLDQEKAFDCVDHAFLMLTLAKFGFGPNFCKWISLFYNSVFSRIICNGKLTAPIFLGRGVRQGCPLSPLLYVLVSEVLSTQIRNCEEIEGFRLPGAGGLHFKISQYADDATNFVKTEQSLSDWDTTYKWFKSMRWGLALNSIPPSQRRCGLVGGEIMAIPLGVFFSNGLICVDNDNWKTKLDKLQSVLNLWSIT